MQADKDALGLAEQVGPQQEQSSGLLGTIARIGSSLGDVARVLREVGAQQLMKAAAQSRTTWYYKMPELLHDHNCQGLLLHLTLSFFICLDHLAGSLGQPSLSDSFSQEFEVLLNTCILTWTTLVFFLKARRSLPFLPSSELHRALTGSGWQLYSWLFLGEHNSASFVTQHRVARPKHLLIRPVTLLVRYTEHAFLMYLQANKLAKDKALQKQEQSSSLPTEAAIPDPTPGEPQLSKVGAQIPKNRAL